MDNLNVSGYSLVRPLSVLRAQLWSFFRRLFVPRRLLTFTDEIGTPPLLVWRVRYLLIEDDAGYVYYQNPTLTGDEWLMIDNLRRMQKMPTVSPGKRGVETPSKTW